MWCEPYMKMILDLIRSRSASSGRGRRRRRRTWWPRRGDEGIGTGEEGKPGHWRVWIYESCGQKLQPNHPATSFPPFPIVLASSDAECSSVMYELQLWGLVCSSLSKQELLLVVQLKQTILHCRCNTTLAKMGSDSALCCSLHSHFQAKLGWLSKTSGDWPPTSDEVKIVRLRDHVHGTCGNLNRASLKHWLLRRCNPRWGI